MSRRTIAVGIDEAKIRALGQPLWEAPSGKGLYVSGRWCTETPWSDMLWPDLYGAYQKHRIMPDNQRFFEAHLRRETYERIAELWNKMHPRRQLSPTAIRSRVQRVMILLERDHDLGEFTVAFEAGGWGFVAELLY